MKRIEWIHDREASFHPSISTSNGLFPVTRLTLIMSPRKESTRLERCGLLTLMDAREDIVYNEALKIIETASLSTVFATLRDCIIVVRTA